jgi:hypothetical protein
LRRGRSIANSSQRGQRAGICPRQLSVGLIGSRGHAVSSRSAAQCTPRPRFCYCRQNRGPASRAFRPQGGGALFPGHRPSASALGWGLPARWAGVWPIVRGRTRGAWRPVEGTRDRLRVVPLATLGARRSTREAGGPTRDARRGVQGAPHGIRGARCPTRGSHHSPLGLHHRTLGAHDRPLGSHHRPLGSHHKIDGSHHRPLGSHRRPHGSRHRPRGSNNALALRCVARSGCAAGERHFVLQKRSFVSHPGSLALHRLLRTWRWELPASRRIR